MNNNTLQIKFKQRLNKIDSQDYDNIQSWEIAEAFNKAQIEWCRRQLSGTNIRKEGDEMSKRRIDDLSLLLKKVKLNGIDIQYDSQFGYFDATNFNQIYDPNLGGDYLEFKRVECAAQQCFPSVAASITETSETVTGFASEDGRWIDRWSVNQAPWLFNVPIFTFQTNGNAPTTISNPEANLVLSWNQYGSPGEMTPSVESTQVTTQEPWSWNNQLQPIVWYTSSNTNEANIYNNNIIFPFVDSLGTLSSCSYCGQVASDILQNTEQLSTMCNNSPTGYLVGGANNEYIDCTTNPATSQVIPNLTMASGIEVNAADYNYLNSPNSWVNNLNNILGSSSIEGQCNASACWYVPSSVQLVTFSVNNFQTYSSAWSELDVVQEEGTYVDPVSGEWEYTQSELELTPFEKCYCAPGADKENFCIRPRTMTVYQSEVANLDVILRDPLKRPDFEWAETFCTLQARENIGAENTGSTAGLRIWRRNFYVMDPKLVYYRTPRRIEIVGSVDPYTGNTVLADTTCEFKDDIVEIIIDSAVSTLAGDISDANQMMRGEQAAEKNN